MTPCPKCGFVFLDESWPSICPRCKREREGPVFYLNWRGIPATQDSIKVKATPGTTIKTAMRKPFGFTVIEQAEVTEGECPSCGLDESLHAGICDRCRVMEGVGS
jgi:hypothetical protein